MVSFINRNSVVNFIVVEIRKIGTFRLSFVCVLKGETCSMHYTVFVFWEWQCYFLFKNIFLHLSVLLLSKLPNSKFLFLVDSEIRYNDTCIRNCVSLRSAREFFFFKNRFLHSCVSLPTKVTNSKFLFLVNFRWRCTRSPELFFLLTVIFIFCFTCGLMFVLEIRKRNTLNIPIKCKVNIFLTNKRYFGETGSGVFSHLESYGRGGYGWRSG